MLSDLILNKGQVLLTQVNDSPIVLDNSPFLFGSIALVSEVSDKFSIGQQVMYNPQFSTDFVFEEIKYSMVDESKILLIYPTPIPT